MKRAWQLFVRFRLVFAAISLIALLVVCWFGNTPASAPMRAAEMPVETAVALGNSITYPSPDNPQLDENPLGLEKEVPVEHPVETPALQVSTQQSGVAISFKPNNAVLDRITATTVPVYPVSSLEVTKLLGTPKEKQK